MSIERCYYKRVYILISHSLGLQSESFMQICRLLDGGKEGRGNDDENYSGTFWPHRLLHSNWHRKRFWDYT